MFFAEDRIKAVREMICARTVEEREAALAKVEPFQQGDFEAMYRIMGERPMTIRYLDPPLHEFLPTKAEDIEALAKDMGMTTEELNNVVVSLHEFNPMMGHRGCRLAVTYPEIAEMQTLFEVGQLELEKSRLANRMKFIALLAGGVLVLLLIGWSVYQYVMVRRLTHIRRQLTDANEEITRQSRRAMESEKMKTAFINSMCHEIRTPLNAINGFSDLLLEGNHDAEARREFREQIWSNTTALTTLLENMLELSSLVSSEAPLPQTDTDIGLLCAERLEYQKRQSNNPQVEYIFKGGGEGPCIIPTNVFYMTRVIDNLLQNAAKFTAAGSVTLSCEKDDSKRRLRIRVADTGIGIDPDKQEWVFERFAKVDPFKPGSGIGLYLCRLIVTRLGGEIRVCPEYRAGCCIDIVLPC